MHQLVSEKEQRGGAGMAGQSQANLLQLIALLRRATPRKRHFNMLLVLRGQSDEVRLHSRFIAALMDPTLHSLGHELLLEFLDAIRVPAEGEHAFFRYGLAVQVEYAGIDILITNSQRQAVLIENKVYAGDQNKQLRRYHDLLLNEGYGLVFVRYLSIDGREPSPQSLSGLDTELPAPCLQCVSYVDQIRTWLSRCEGIAVRDVPLRESISQYAAVIDQLTGNDQEKGYMDAIVETLLIGENMVLARDIRAAYVKGLVELQDLLWTDIERALMRDHEQMFSFRTSNSLATSPERKTVIEHYYRPTARSNRYYGLYFAVPGWRGACACIEIEAHLYSGIRCDKKSYGGEHKRALQVLEEAGITGECTEYLPFWQWCAPKHDLREPDEATLAMLTDECKRAEFARNCADAVAMSWRALGGGG